MKGMKKWQGEQLVARKIYRERSVARANELHALQKIYFSIGWLKNRDDVSGAEDVATRIPAIRPPVWAEPGTRKEILDPGIETLHPGYRFRVPGYVDV